MEEFDVLLTDISRVSIEITRTNAKNGQKNEISLNIDNQSGKKHWNNPWYVDKFWPITLEGNYVVYLIPYFKTDSPRFPWQIMR